MSTYLDVNVIIPLFVADAHNRRAEQALLNLNDDLFVSDLSVAEFSAVIARQVRTGDLHADEAGTAFETFDRWCAEYTRRIAIATVDLAAATALLRRFELSLRTPDALHLALVRRIGCKLLTFDNLLVRAARTIEVELVSD